MRPGRKGQSHESDRGIAGAGKGRMKMGGSAATLGILRPLHRPLQRQLEYPQSGGVGVAAHRALLMKARADLFEMEVEQRRGMLVVAKSIEAERVSMLTLL